MDGSHRSAPPPGTPSGRPGLARVRPPSAPTTVQLARPTSRRSELNRCTLTILSGGISGSVFTVGSAPLLLGRSRQCELCFDDPSVSSIHAEISRASGELYIRDLGSTNGTLLNGLPLLKPRALRDGDRIQLGREGVVRVSFGDEGEELARRRLYERAIRDRLTGLYNRAFFDERIEIEFAAARHHRQPLALLLTDLDHFKSLNDRYGHLGGDEALRAVGAIFREAARKEDIAARFGGEELVLVARGIDVQSALAMAERLRRAIRLADIVYRGERLLLSGSFGVAVHTPETPFETTTELILAADRALYRAKRDGRDRVALSDPMR